MKKSEGGLRLIKGGSPKVNSLQRPLVSIITAVLNGEQTIAATINTIRHQKYSNVEYIIIDGGSTDRTIEIIRENEDCIDYWISEPDKGVYDAWNKGIALTHGEWIGFLGAGDKYREDAVESYISKIQVHPNSHVEYISGKVEYDLPNYGVKRIIGSGWEWRRFRKYMNVGHVGSLQRRTLYQKYGFYDTNYKICGDYEFLLRPRKNLQTDFVNIVTVSMRGGGISYSGLTVFNESMRAKVETGGRNQYLACLEKYVAIAKFFVRSIFYKTRFMLKMARH